MSAANHTPILSAEDIEFKDGEARVLDLRLTETLGFTKLYNIRDLINRHEQALNEFGQVFRTVRKTSAQGGRPGQEYWLNQDQAIYLCAKSETEKATEITIQVVKTFSAVQRGDLDEAVRVAGGRPEVRVIQPLEPLGALPALQDTHVFQNFDPVAHMLGGDADYWGGVYLNAHLYLSDFDLTEDQYVTQRDRLAKADWRLRQMGCEPRIKAAEVKEQRRERVRKNLTDTAEDGFNRVTRYPKQEISEHALNQTLDWYVDYPPDEIPSGDEIRKYAAKAYGNRQAQLDKQRPEIANEFDA